MSKRDRLLCIGGHLHQSISYSGMAEGLPHKEVVDQVLSPEASPPENELFIVRVAGDEEPSLSSPLDSLDSFSHGPEKIWGRDPRHRFLERTLPRVIDVVPIGINWGSNLDGQGGSIL